jgi:formyl-CoA transferase/CoA:oxalate CoA-transferase
VLKLIVGRMGGPWNDAKQSLPGLDFETPRVDFAAMAKSMGLDGERVAKAAELRPALERAFAAKRAVRRRCAARPARRGRMTQAPLAGIRVLDASQVLSGPYCSMMLADAGAEVIKIEPVDGGDHVRSWITEGDFSAYFYAANRSKRSVTIDLKRAGGRALFLDLAERSDVVLENFRPGVMARLGVGYDDVRARNPRAVYCSISGFGQTGPLAPKAAYDLIAAGYGGTMSVTGDAGGRYVRPGVPISDLLAALTAAYSITLALRSRDTTGEGAYLDISLLDGQLFAMSHHLVAYR